ncbi:hypothetical protein, conserved [Eimeria tenella]|uniref:Uncharacterized protein n=1 Tax=Eimeria tenella TaxID=5802 RepID=U6L2E3_EIMTE|nr:hypothetical protein, conserved [Eimeria tenella]CDJ41915.1 hypothetical protein, conserved [Eimeria tenella]|eukprot:XP_013232665.1 hypothetical protein, conserved [Eimeria tenella]
MSNVTEVWNSETVRLLPHESHLCPNGLPSECTYTPFWDRSFRSGSLLGCGSTSGCSIVYRGRSPEPSSLLTCYLGGFKLHDRSLPLGRISKKTFNPLLEVEVVNAVGVCYFDQLLSDHPLCLCLQPSCCCCSGKLPTDPDPYSLRGDGKKAAAAAAAARSRRVTVLEEYVPYGALQEVAKHGRRTPVLVLPCGAAHSALELVAISHKVGDVVYTRGLPRNIRSQQYRGERGSDNESRERRIRRVRHGISSSSSNSRSSSTGSDQSLEGESGSDSFGLSEWETSMQAAGCSLGLEGRRLAELHPNVFQWTRGEGQRLRRDGTASCEKQNSSSSCCCCFCCWCPMGDEADKIGSARNIYARGDARHAPDLVDTIKPKESVVSERVLEVRTDDKHPFIKLVYARNSRGLYVARLRYDEDDFDPAEATEALKAATRRQQGIQGSQSETDIRGWLQDGGLRRQLKVEVLHDAPYGYRVPRQEGGRARHKDREAGVLRFGVPKQIPAHPTVINIAVSPADVGEAALLYSSQYVSLWRAEEARMEVPAPVSLSVVTRNIKRASRPSMRYRHRAVLADPAAEAFQTLCYLPHQRQTLLLGSENLWALDLRAKGMTRLFPALHAPTHSSTLQCIAETLYAPCTANSTYHTTFTALAPHPVHPFLLAAVHDATESIYLFDVRAMHEPLTVVGLPTVRKMGSRYRSLLWHSSTDKWAQAEHLESMRATRLSSDNARKAAFTFGACAAHHDPSYTHDLLAAFSWKSDDVVCSALRVHPAFCPRDPMQPFGTSSREELPQSIHFGGSGVSATRQDHPRLHNKRPYFEASPLEAVKRSCLPTVINREAVEVSWQAEVSMFPRVSWGLENRERCSSIPSKTPIGSPWTQQRPLQVTVDEHAATATFHGYAGACLFELPITGETRQALAHEGHQQPTRTVRCSVCGSRNPLALAAAWSISSRTTFCRNCLAPISHAVSVSKESTGSLVVLSALTTSGRLTCRPLTLNDPVLRLKLQNRCRLYSKLARRQRFKRKEDQEAFSAFGVEPGKSPQASEPSEALAALLSFHTRRFSREYPCSIASGKGSIATYKPSGHQAVHVLLKHLHANLNEKRVLPQRISVLLLQAQLQQTLQRELLFRAAVKLQRSQQLHLLRRVSFEDHLVPCEEVAGALLGALRLGLVAMKFSGLWPRRLASFAFCDSGAFGIHRPAFITEAYDPEPVVQVLLASRNLDAYLNGTAEGHPTESGKAKDLQDDEQRASTEGEADQNSYMLSLAGSEHSQSLLSSDFNGKVPSSGGYLPENEEPQRFDIASAARELLETEPEEPGFTAVTEISALPFSTSRSRAVFRYAVEAVEALSYVTPGRSLLQLRDEGTVLLHDVLMAVQMWRDGVLTDAQVLSLLCHFTISRPCTTGILDMQRTTLPLSVPVARSPQEALKTAMEVAQGSHLQSVFNSTRRANDGVLNKPTVGPEEAYACPSLEANESPGGLSTGGTGEIKNEFWKVSNPALAPAVLCCCKVLLQHHCDVHACTVGDQPAWPMPGGDYRGVLYPHTDGVQALLEVLKSQFRNYRAENRCGDAVRHACFIPQAIVDELAEALFLTHEVLLLPVGDYKALEPCHQPTKVSCCGSEGPTSSSANDLASVENPSRRCSGHQNLPRNERNFDAGVPQLFTQKVGGSSAIDVTSPKCPLASPWIPSYCISRHLHTFSRTDTLTAEDDHLQQELQQYAWRDLLQHQQMTQMANAARPGDFAEQHFSRYPSSPTLRLPQSMRCRLPDHVLQGLAHSKWGRLLCGIAVNDVLIADILSHWDVSAVQRMRGTAETQRQVERRTELDREDGRPSRRKGALTAVDDLPRDPAGRVSDELCRLLGLLPQTPLQYSLFVSVQERQQEQRRVQAERQQLLESIAQAMRRRA